MVASVIAQSGLFQSNLPAWGRCFWQDPNDGAVFLAYTSGTTEVDYIYSLDSGLGWSQPAQLFPVDDFTNDNNFDICMDRRGHIHSVFKWNGSGCYQFTGRIPGAGYTNDSGVGPAGFCLSTDGASSSKGLHASIFITDGPVGLFGDPVTQHPAARIACKRADQEVQVYNVTSPFNTYPAIQSGVCRLGETAGPYGGYPIVNDGGNFGGLAVSYSASGSLMRWVHAQFGTFELLEQIPIVRDPHHTGNGGSGLMPYGPQMAFTSGIIGKLNPVVVSSASGCEMYTTFAEAAGAGAGFRRVDSTANLIGLGLERRAPNGIPFAGTAPSGMIFGVEGSGTRVDISHGNSRDAMHIYYLAPDTLGVQTVNRVMCRVQREESSSDTAATQYEFSSESHFVSGVRTFAPATANHTGGFGNIAHWKNFKALKHPVRGGEGVTKKELVVTVGAEPIYPSGSNLVIWDYDDSVAGQETYRYPVYDYNYVATSGDPVSPFGGVYRTLKVTNPHNAFDDNGNTDAVIQSGSSITLEFLRPTLINKVELAAYGSSASNRCPGAVVSGSMDGINWHYLHAIGSGYTSAGIRVSAENPQGSDVNERMDPWIAKYLKFDFRQAQKPRGTNYFLTEMRLYGPGQFKGDVSYNMSSFAESQAIIRPEASRATQRFNTVTEGGLPGSDWRTYGNFTWGVRSSGSWSRTSSLDNRPYPQNGYVGSGIFAGDSNGNGDGFSLKPNDCVPVNSSGVAQVNLIVYSNEANSSGVLGSRTISFDYRTDFPGSDDRCDVYVSSFGASTEGTLIRRITTPNVDWNNMAFDVGAGNLTLKWIYTRGATPGTSANIGQIWIDNIVGLTGPAQPSIGGFINGEATPISGVIHGFLNSKGAQQIHAYMSGAPLYSTIHGVLDASPFESGAIHGYMSASMNESIHGYMFGVGTEMTSSIHGVMGSLVPNSGSSVHAFMIGEGESNRIHGFLMAQSGQMGSIYGYMSGDDFDSFIHGYMDAYSLPSGAIHGYLDSRNVNDFIYGYMGNNALAPSGGGTVAGGPGGAGSTSGVNPTNWVHGYLKGEEASQFIHAYLEGPPGQIGSIYGYMPVGDNVSIHGFVHAALSDSGNIHGFASGVGFSSSSIKGYMYGVSGVASSSIHSYLAGVMTPSGDIYGFIIGIPDGVTSSGTCYSHGSIPIRPVTPATIPSGWFNA